MTMKERNRFRRLLPNNFRVPIEKPKTEAELEAEYVRLHAEYKAGEKVRLDKLPAGPGLKEYEIDLHQTNDYGRKITALGSNPLYKSMGKVLRAHKEANPEKKDPENKSNLYAAAILGQSSVSNELKRWIQEHTPQNTYFTPEMVADAVAGRDDVHVETGQRDGLSTWRFSTPTGASKEMSRTADGSKPTIPVNPYLVVHYWQEYDFDPQEIVATPSIGDSQTEGETATERGALRGELGQILMASLGVGEVRVHQAVDFRIVESAPTSFLKSYDGDQLDPAYVAVPAYVRADLPR